MSLDTIIELQNVSVYQKNVLVLSGVNFSLERGEFCYLIGRTGTGKSSLMKLLYADLPVVDGQGRVAGFDLGGIKDRQIPFLRRKIGIVFQDFQLLTDRSVRDNLLFVMRATGWRDRVAMETRLNEVLDKVGLVTKGFKMPHQLSGGEQQRVAIARAIAKRPAILLCDEPTGALDVATGILVLAAIEQVNRELGTTTVVITHNAVIASMADRVIKMSDGQIAGIDVNRSKLNPRDLQW